MTNRASGFTLIELMVVIVIISSLMVFLLPDILGSQEKSDQLGDQSNLRFHYQQMLSYQSKYKRLPRGEGHQFIFDPWVRGVVNRSAENRDRFFSPGKPRDYEEGDELHTIMQMDPKEIWSEKGSITSLHTDYAGISLERKKGKKLGQGGVILMALDNNEDFEENIYSDASIPILKANGATPILLMDPDFIKYGLKVGDYVKVGPDSEIEELQGLVY